MATRPLPTIATDPQGRPVKQDSGEALLKHNAAMADIQKIQLDILTDLLGVMKNIAENVIFIYRTVAKSIGEYVNVMDFQGKLTAAIEKSRGDTKNKLAEAEKEREGKLGAGAAKPESLLDSLKKIFEEYFGVFRIVFNALRLILLPLVFGFIAGFREKFDLFTVALGVAIMFPIKTFKFMVKVFGFLFETLKSIGKLISKIGPAFQDAVQGITNFFRRMRIFFLRTLKLGEILKPITSLFSSGRGIFQSLFKVITPLFNALKFLARPLTIIFAIIGGIKGAIEGFKKEGFIGGVKGLIAGAIDGAFGWIFDVIGWVFGKLGFEDAEKALEEFGLFELISGLLDSLFGSIGKTFKMIMQLLTGDFEGFVNSIGSVFDGFKDILEAVFGTLGFDNIAAMLREFSFVDLFTELWQAIKDWVSGAITSLLGFGDDDAPKPDEKEDGGDVAKAQEKLKAAGVDDAADAIEGKDVKEAKKLLMEKHGFTEKGADQLLGISTPTPTPKPTAVPPQNKAEDIDKKTREAETAKKPEPPKPTQNNTTVVNAPNNSKTTANMNPAPHADRVGIGSRGNAAYAGFGKSY